MAAFSQKSTDSDGGQRGFSLIELMVVVAIIAILASIALVAFPPYVARTQLTSALADIAPGKTFIEASIYDGRPASIIGAEFIGRAQYYHCSDVSAELSDSGVGFITCTVKGNGAVNGKELTLNRSSEGVWTCDASAFDSWYRPPGC